MDQPSKYVHQTLIFKGGDNLDLIDPNQSTKEYNAFEKAMGLQRVLDSVWFHARSLDYQHWTVKSDYEKLVNYVQARSQKRA